MNFVKNLSFPLPVHLLLGFIIALSIIAYQSTEYEPRLRTGDSYIYLSTAKDLVDKGVMTNGTFGHSFPEKGKNGEGLFFTPIYPAFLASIMTFDQKFYDDVTCHMDSIGTQDHVKCGNYYDSVIHAQIILGAITALLIWLTAFLMTKQLALSWAAFFIGLASGVYGQYATEIMTEAVLFPLFAAASLFSVLGWQYRDKLKQSLIFWVLAGLFFGLATLTRPAYAYVIYVGMIFLYFFYLIIAKQGFKKSLRYPLMLFLGFALIVGPWVLRNGLATGEYAISKGYGPYILIQRLAYNDMTWKEWGASFFYYLPDFGDKLAHQIFDEKDYERFNYENKEGFFYVGHTRFRQQVLEEAGSVDNLMSTALHNHLIPNLSKHVMVTFSMLLNGIGISKYWGMITLPLLALGLLIALKRRWYEFIILAFPGIFMLGFHAFTSVNVARYNMPLVPCLAIAAAWMIFELYRLTKRKIKKA